MAFRINAVLYTGFEMLDLFGPLEMFSMLGDEVEITTVAEHAGSVASAKAAAIGAGPEVVAAKSFADADQADLVLLPGGFGTFPELENEALLSFLRAQSENAQYVASVCTGSALLAKAGLLDGKKATSNKQFFVLAEQQSDKVDWQTEARWVEDGKFFTSSGVSAGMDMAVSIIDKHFGPETRTQVTEGVEYVWHDDPSSDPFVGSLNVGAKAMGMA